MADEGEIMKTRLDEVNEFLAKYPIESYEDWYKSNYPDVYAGYVHAKNAFYKPEKPVTVKEKAKVSLKLLGITLSILAVFAVIVYFVLMWLFSQAGGMFI